METVLYECVRPVTRGNIRYCCDDVVASVGALFKLIGENTLEYISPYGNKHGTYSIEVTKDELQWNFKQI